MPMVTTARIRRGAWRKRRTMAISTKAPRPSAPTTRTTRAAPYGHAFEVISSTANTAGTAPSPAWAKFTTWLAR
jgi:hypothetical protein